ncbi:unnamed protein product, partial [Hapterophycus canaliculatus]
GVKACLGSRCGLCGVSVVCSNGERRPSLAHRERLKFIGGAIVFSAHPWAAKVVGPSPNTCSRCLKTRRKRKWEFAPELQEKIERSKLCLDREKGEWPRKCCRSVGTR